MLPIVLAFINIKKSSSNLKLKSSEKLCILSVIGLTFALFVLRSFAPENVEDIEFPLFFSTCIWLALVVMTAIWGLTLIWSAIAEYLKRARLRNSSFGKFLNWLMRSDR